MTLIMARMNNLKLFLLFVVLTLALLERTGSEWVMREVGAVRNSERNWAEPSWIWHPLKRTDKRERDWIHPTHPPEKTALKANIPRLPLHNSTNEAKEGCVSVKAMFTAEFQFVIYKGIFPSRRFS